LLCKGALDSIACYLIDCRVQWGLSERLFVQRIHLAAARRSLANVIAAEAAAGRPLPGAATAALDDRLNAGAAPALFAFSPALLPKPADWPGNHHVVGQFLPRSGPAAAPKPLPASLQAYLDACRRDSHHVIYIGFGSLGFFAPERVTAILDVVAAAMECLARELPVRAVIQTALSSTPGKTGTLSAGDGGQHPYHVFAESVNHAALFPQVSLVVSHGGVGTVATALGAGKPVLSMCCLPTADQSFWADLCFRRK
jgi:sterol 3beta-glucosyltransferase